MPAWRPDKGVVAPCGLTAARCVVCPTGCGMFDESAAVPAAPEYQLHPDESQPLGPYSCPLEKAGGCRRRQLLLAGSLCTGLAGNRHVVHRPSRQHTCRARAYPCHTCLVHRPSQTAHVLWSMGQQMAGLNMGHRQWFSFSRLDTTHHNRQHSHMACNLVQSLIKTHPEPSLVHFAGGRLA
jgi:hypothetical protein